MFPNSTQYPSASKAFLESQLGAFNAIANIMVQAVQKITTLNMAAAKAASEDAMAAAKELLVTKDAYAFFSLTSEFAKPAVEKIAAYNHQLTDIASASKAEFTKLAEAHASEVRGTVSDLVNAIAKDAPDGSESAVALLKSSVANANDGYEKMRSATKQVIEAAEEHVTKASDHMADAARKATPR